MPPALPPLTDRDPLAPVSRTSRIRRLPRVDDPGSEETPSADREPRKPPRHYDEDESPGTPHVDEYA